MSVKFWIMIDSYENLYPTNAIYWKSFELGNQKAQIIHFEHYFFSLLVCAWNDVSKPIRIQFFSKFDKFFLHVFLCFETTIDFI